MRTMSAVLGALKTKDDVTSLIPIFWPQRAQVFVGREIMTHWKHVKKIC